MKLHHITAIFKKTAKDMFKNKRQLFFFLLFPIFTYLFYYMIPDQHEMFSVMYLPINVLFCSLNIMAAVIAEEKEKGTLRSLIFANIKPIEYFIGTGLFVMLATLASCALFLPLIENMEGVEYLIYFGLIALSSICSMILGATVGVCVKNQMAANGLCAPITIVIGMLPTFGAMNETFRNVSELLYTTKFANTVAEIVYNQAISMDWKIILTYVANFAICFVIFHLVYRKKKLDD